MRFIFVMMIIGFFGLSLTVYNAYGYDGMVLSMQKDMYYPNDIVTINGTTTSNHPVDVSIKNPFDKTVLEKYIVPSQSGQFSISFVVDSYPTRGTYVVLATQDSYTVTSYFGVYSKPSIRLESMMDKMNYQNNEQPKITIFDVPESVVSLQLLDNSQIVKFADKITTDAKGYTTYSLDITSYPVGTYYVVVTSNTGKTTLGFTVGLLPSGGKVITLDTDKHAYVAGENMTVAGYANANTLLQVSLIDPAGFEINSKLFSDKTGHFWSNLQIPITAISGNWTVNVSSGVSHTSTAFQVTTNDGNVTIVNIKTTPPVVKIGDMFSISATLINDSPNTIGVTIAPCGEPFPTQFDRHVKVEHVANMTCPLFLFEEKINPGQKVNFTIPNMPIPPAKNPSSYLTKPMTGNVISYQAVMTGTANATISIPYTVTNTTDQTHSQISKTISKSFEFEIEPYPVSLPDNANKIQSPLEQFRNGISVHDVKCQDGFILVTKASDNSPACVKPLTYNSLALRGWAKLLGVTTTSYVDVNGTRYDVPYIVRGWTNDLLYITADSGYHALTVYVKSTADRGEITLTIPRALLDSKINNQDTRFVVLVDGKETTYKETTSSDSRTVTIPFDLGAKKIEILSTQRI